MLVSRRVKTPFFVSLCPVQGCTGIHRAVKCLMDGAQRKLGFRCSEVKNVRKAFFTNLLVTKLELVQWHWAADLVTLHKIDTDFA